jgi:HAE1 family hydrophobic/amphiphilic exporter-1
VDDAIVVLENTVRHLEQGKTKLQAALDGAKQISTTVLSMTISLAAVFIPMLFMKGMVGRLFTEFAVVIIATIAISGVVSLTLSPLLCSRFLVPHHLKSKSFLEKLSEKINALFLNTYLSFLNIIMGHKLSTLCFGLVALILTGVLTFVTPKDFIPPDDLGIVEGFLKMEDGTSPFETIRVQQEIGKILQKNECCDSIVTVGAAPTSNQGAFYINLKPRSKRESIFDLIPKFYEQLSSMTGVQIFMKPYPLFELSIGTSASLGAYQYTLQSFNTEKLYKTAEIFMEKMKTIAGVSQVTSDMFNKEPQVNVLIDRDKAYNFNISANDIELAIGYAYGGTKISQINGAIDQYDVVLETLPEAYKDPYMMSKLYVSDAQVPLSNLAKITEGIGPLMVNHLNTLPSVTITFEVEKGTPLGVALGEIQNLASEVLPTDVIGEVQGTAKVFQETFRSLVPLVIITLFIIYVILGILYENFVHPITVMSVLPPTAMGGLLTLFVCQEAISLYSFVGIMMLLGIVLKNGIILIDFAIEEMEKNKLSPQEAMISACKIRFRPILMTTIAALMGAIPIAIGYGGSLAEARRPLGIAIVGGLIFSQLLTLFLTPVIFIYLERVRAFFKKG